MENAFDELTRAISLAEDVRSATRSHGNAILDLLDGNLRGLSQYRLARLKKQLNDFNAHTGRWKNDD